MTATRVKSNSIGLCVYILFVFLKVSQGQSIITFGLMVPVDLARNSSVISGSYYASAALLAVDKVNGDSTILPGRTLKFLWNATDCNKATALRTLTTQWKKGVSAFIGPGCRCETEATVSAALMVPLISQLCTNDELSDKTIYPTFVRTIPANSRLAPPVLKLLQNFNWTRIGLVMEDGPEWIQRGKAIQQLLTANGINVAIQRIIPSASSYSTNSGGRHLEKVIRDVQEVSRIFVFAMDYSLVGEAVHYAGKVGLNMSNYAFIMFALDRKTVWENTKTPTKWFINKYADNKTTVNETTRQAFESSLLISVNPVRSGEYQMFVNNLRNRTNDAPFYSTVYQGSGINTEPPIQGAYLYDAILQYAVALNRTLSAGDSISDSNAVLSNIKGRFYKSIVGYDRYINSKGDAEFDLVLMDYTRTPTENFQTVGAFGIDNHGAHVLKMSSNLTVKWPGKKGPPKDRPECGFYGESCRKGNNITIGLLVPYIAAVGYGNSYAAGKYTAAAITVALEKLNSDKSILPGHHINFYWKDTKCNDARSIAQMVEFVEKKVDAFIGFACHCTTQSRIAASLNLPLVSHLCTSDQVSDKKLFPTFARTIPADGAIGSSVVALLEYFNWDTIGIISEEDAVWESRGAFVEKYLKENGKTVNVLEKVTINLLYTPEKHEGQIKSALRKIKEKSRIIILTMKYSLAREIVYFAAELGMNTGEFAFILLALTADEVKLNNEDQTKWFNGRYLKTRSPTAAFRKAFESVLVMVANTQGSKENDLFNYKVKIKTREAPFFTDTYYGIIQLPPPIGDRNKFEINVPVYAAYLHDAAFLYALAVNKTFQQGYSYKNGAKVASNMFGTKYHSVLGTDVYMNKVGDVEYNLTLMDYRSNGTKEWLENVGLFQITEEKNTSQVFVLYRNSTIQWPDGSKAPVAVPRCGFDGEFCIDNRFKLTTIEIICIVLAATLVLFVLIGGIVYRKQKLEKELESESWRVDYRDVVIRGPRRLAGSLRSQVSLLSGDSFDNINQRQIFTNVGMYKSNTVTIKKINKRSIELTRDIKMELNLMRTVRHENLTPFLGACVDAPNICILLQYCPKGSLQDILENEDIKLDSMFVDSLLTDIVKGMAYLHSTDIRSHGRLKSSNCVVDGRWVLKITDYGLTKFKGNQEEVEVEGDYAKYYCKLWTAPELLRNENCSPQGTQKGDVYGFSIILQELLTRSGPFDLTYYNTEPIEIIQRVKAGEIPSYRPKLSNIILESATVPGIQELAERCWDESPEHRPDFEEIRKHVRKLSMGKHTNIMDNMVNMLEKYANNLESLVEERTAQLAEEKRKTENLLNRMLPPSVARDLVQGKPIAAENFDEVSIFFSDIVGFTSISSECTPLQVVDLLNDLYTLFDDIINHYDVYKVETIGDAYMVVSGLPIPNGYRHAGEIASMALHMLRDMHTFKIRHRPNDKLKLRIGIHSGSACAGVVGIKMPRYCLFGDTVNTASRMESNGEPLKIHISPATKKVLQDIGGYHIEERGEVFLKGKGTWLTYWLVGSDIPPRTGRPPVVKETRKDEAPQNEKTSNWDTVKKMLPKISTEAFKNRKLPPPKSPPSDNRTSTSLEPIIM